MARQRYTHRRPLRTGAEPDAVVRYYRTYRRCHGDTLAEFVAHYGKLWDEANRYGVKPYEGIVRLVELFPPEWQGWMAATAQLYTSSQPPTYEPIGDMPGFLSAVSAGCFHFGNGPPPDTQAPGSERFHSLPPLALMRAADGVFEKGQSSRVPDRRRSRAEMGDMMESSDEIEPMESGTGEEEDPEEDMVGVDNDDGEEEPQIGGLADLVMGTIPPQPREPPPPMEPFHEELEQPLHPVDQDFYRGLYLYAKHVDPDFVADPSVPVAPDVTPVAPQPVVASEDEEELWSPIEMPFPGTSHYDPVWISSDSE